MALLAPTAALAQTVCQLPLSAYVTDDAGAPLDGFLDVELRFYEEDSDVAVPVECRTMADASVDDGWLRMTVDACSAPEAGDCGAISLSELLSDGSGGLWVGVVIAGEELAPRVPFGAVPLALRAARAGDANTLGGLGSEAFEPSGAIDAHATEPSAHHSETSDGLELTPSTVTLGEMIVAEGTLDFGPDADDELTTEIVRTLTGGGDADALHSHAASGDGGGGCMTAWGRADCPTDYALFYLGETVQNLAAQQNDSSPETISMATSQIMCFDPAGLPTSAAYTRSYFTWGLMRVGSLLMYTGTEAIPCAVCCR